MLMMNTKFYVYHDPKTCNHVFAHSRVFVFEPVLASMMENGMAVPPADMPKFQLPSHAGVEEKDSASFVVANHKLWLRYLSGKSLENIMNVYTDLFYKTIESHLDLGTSAWQMVNLHELLRKLVFETSVATFFGPRIWKLWPKIWDDFNEFNKTTYIGVRTNAAYSFRPRARKARERMLLAFEEWINHDVAETWSEDDGEWNETWGTKLNWERELQARQFGFSRRGRACLHASFLFVAVVNALPLVAWFTWCATSSAERLERFLLEATKFMVPSGIHNRHKMQIHSSALKENAWVQGLWKEALRLGTAGAAARVVMETSELEGYLLQKGSVILMPAALMHYDERFFPDPDKVKPERWILGSEADAESVDLLQQRQRSLRPFGGGTGLCSGRFVAENEIIGIVSALLLLFDIKFGESWYQGYRFNPRSIGFMESMNEETAYLRRRKEHA